MKNKLIIYRRKKQKGVRAKLFGEEKRPRISVYRSNAHIYAQAIDDRKMSTIAYSNDLKLKEIKGKKSDIAFQVGKNLAEKLKKININEAVFDRGRYPFKGRISALANGLRSGGIKV